LAWYQGGFRGAFSSWITRLVTEFKDSPAVAIWEIMNEPGAGVENMSPAVIKQFYDATAAHIKQIDPVHLVSTGALAPWQAFQHGVAGYAAAHSGPNIDLISLHEYDYPHSNGRTVVSQHFQPALAAAESLDMPVYVGETGVSMAHGCMTAEQRADALRHKFAKYLDAGAVGVLYWVVLGPPNNPGVVCDSDYGNRDPMLGGPVMDMIAHYQP
jgi:mannan endo-1,4-beta-mannosidase